MYNMRVGGLATGMDIDQIVQDMMRIERQPLDRIFQQRQELQWKQEDYRSLNNQMARLRSSALSLRLQGTFNSKIATSSNENIVTVSARGNASAGTYDISVSQLAGAAHLTSSGGIGIEDSTAPLSEQGLDNVEGKYRFTINEVEIEFDADKENIQGLVNKINRAVDDEGNSIGVRAAYDSDLDRFFLSTTGTGTDAEITIKPEGDGGDALWEALKFEVGDGGVITAQGRNAKFTLNGAELEKSTNEFTINDLNFNLKGVSPSDAGGVSVVVRNDEEGVFQLINDFVELYNETITLANGKMLEKYHRDYPPLTDEMRGEMSDSQVEKWEEKARSGMLRNDPMLADILSDMRRSLSSVLDEGGLRTLASIGITTGDYSERGILHVDEGKLRNAISQDLEGVKDLFTKTDMGIAHRLYDSTVSGTAKITAKAGIESDFSLVDDSFIGKRIRNLDKNMGVLEDRLQRTEERLWRQFTALEMAIDQMNAQSMWLTQQFSMWGGR
ncbi:MAG: flagellar filament capping protein FliD [Clostridia bacterium]|nr:flagellar filament capping protein FliD [Clostridia bacterium]